MRLKVYHWYAIAWSFLILILLCIPSRGMSDQFFSFLHLDKIVHFSLFGIFSYLWRNVALKSGHSNNFYAHFIFLAGSLYGIVLEFVQTLPFIARSFDYLDMVANSIGCGLIYVFLIRDREKE